MEKFKIIKWTKDLYYIGSHGNVLKNSASSVDECKKLKLIRKKSGYLSVTLCVDKVKHQVRVHRLVAEAFLSNFWNKRVVHHKDGRKDNNHYKNLEWCTHKENIRHACESGAMKGGSGAHKRKLSDREAKEIRKIYDSSKGETQTSLAKRFGIARTTVGCIVRNETYRGQS